MISLNTLVVVVSVCVLLICIPHLAEGSPLNTARLALFNYPWEVDGTPYNDDGYTKLIHSMAPLAVSLFNDRRDDVLPVLGTLGSCNKQLSIPYTCSTAGNSRLAFAQALEVTNSVTDYPHAM